MRPIITRDADGCQLLRHNVIHHGKPARGGGFLLPDEGGPYPATSDRFSWAKSVRGKFAVLLALSRLLRTDRGVPGVRVGVLRQNGFESASVRYSGPSWKGCAACFRRSSGRDWRLGCRLRTRDESAYRSHRDRTLCRSCVLDILSIVSSSIVSCGQSKRPPSRRGINAVTGVRFGGCQVSRGCGP